MTASPRVSVIPGDGVVIRHGATVLVLGQGHPAGEMVEQLTAIAAAPSDDDRLRRLGRLVLDVDDPPPIAVVTLEEAGASVFLHGDMELVAPGQRTCGSDHVLGMTATVSPTDAFTVASSGVPPPDPESWNDLEGGRVHGGGVMITPRSGDPADAITERDLSGLAAVDVTHEQPVGRGEPEPDFETISLIDGATVAQRAPLPIEGTEELPEAEHRPAYAEQVDVLGVYSPSGFFNHPDARYCSRTGVKMGASRTKILATGPRPPLGVITFDDGSTLTVQWTTVIGREQAADGRVVSEEAAPFVVSDEERSVSRRHALLELVDWDVVLSDLGSRNGTYIQLDDGQPARRLAGDERVVLPPGAKVHIGNRSFTYSAHHIR